MSVGKGKSFLSNKKDVWFREEGKVSARLLRGGMVDGSIRRRALAGR